MKPRGLSSAEASKQLSLFGPNEVVPKRLDSFFSEIKKIFLDPMGLMLLGLGGLYWFLGDRTDAVILFIAFIPVTAIDVILEIRSGRVLKALRSTLAVTAKVYRDGEIKEIHLRDIVPGDLLVFEEGQTLPADGEMIEADNLSVNEAALTGESLPVLKALNDKFFGGTVILTGRGLGQVKETGPRTKFGAIANLLSEVESVKSPLRKKVDHLVQIVLIFAFVLAVVLFFLEWSRTKQIIPSLIIALTLGMAAVPEEFPLVFTLYLSLGAWRLSKKGLLVKSLPGVETLGGVDVICTDKTGTLTEGLFELEEIRSADHSINDGTLWQAALMACEVHAVDSLEVAIIQKAAQRIKSLEGWALQFDYPFENLGKHMSHVWRRGTDGRQVIAMKGAVEGVLEHCATTDTQKKEILATVGKLASTGKRILGLAQGERPMAGDRSRDEKDLSFIGFFVFADPVRSSVREAIQKCQAAGIEVKMLTGDHLLTAHAVADQIGMAHGHEQLFTGAMLSEMSSSARKEAYQKGALFARVQPEEKYEMVKTLQEQGKIVAMTGDGINDAPALKLADIGISMGKNATDVARSTAKMVLLQNDFAGIVYAVFEGRKVFANLRRSFSYLISFHIPVVLLALLPPFLGWPPLLLPVHIIILELIVHPISAFTFENLTDPKLEKNQKGALLSRKQFVEAAIPGTVLSGFALILFYLNLGVSEGLARSVAFSTVLIGNIFFVLTETVPIVNRRFFSTAIIIILVTVGFTQLAFFQSYLHFEIVPWSKLLWPLLAGLGATCFPLLPRLFGRR